MSYEKPTVKYDKFLYIPVEKELWKFYKHYASEKDLSVSYFLRIELRKLMNKLKNNVDK